jgi:hypothetical protein
MDMRFVTWNVRTHCWAGLLMTIVKELLKYRIDLVGV